MKIYILNFESWKFLFFFIQIFPTHKQNSWAYTVIIIFSCLWYVAKLLSFNKNDTDTHIHSVLRAAVTKYHKVDGLKEQMYSHCSGGWQSDIKMSAGLCSLQSLKGIDPNWRLLTSGGPSCSVACRQHNSQLSHSSHCHMAIFYVWVSPRPSMVFSLCTCVQISLFL